MKVHPIRRSARRQIAADPGRVAVVGLFPFSKLIWLAFDLMLRPVTPAELDWHRTEAAEWSSERSAPPDL